MVLAQVASQIIEKKKQKNSSSFSTFMVHALPSGRHYISVDSQVFKNIKSHLTVCRDSMHLPNQRSMTNPSQSVVESPEPFPRRD